MLPPPNPLSPEHRRQLLTFVRQILDATIKALPVPAPPAELAEYGNCGAFVSLHTQARLRGCIGVVESSTSLAETLTRCARGAALEDRRFQPLTGAELDRVAIEISLLSPLQAASPDQVEPGTHGLLIRKEFFTGLLLPQVAQKYKWSRERFLEETCVKAGLPRKAWQDPAAKLFVFTAQVFSE